MAEAFARKHRPKDLATYMGAKIKNTVQNRFSDKSKFPNTILLHGTRGCGKTTLARILAKEYQCTDRQDGHACGKCEMCLEIDEKLIELGVAVMNIQEVDIATESGKDAMDDILEDALIEPLYGDYKIIILDEFHRASKGAQNRLLKIMEEPPKFLVFILCTTEIHEVLGTIVSRCQLKIEVKKHSVDELANRLLEVCKEEKITTSMEALKIIAKKADRVPREALNLLEDIAGEYANHVTIENVRNKTGDIASEIYMEYYKSANRSLEAIMIFNKKLKELDITPKSFVRGLTRFTLDCVYLRYAIGIEDYPEEYVKAVRAFFKIYNSEEMDFLLQVIEYASKMIDDDDIKAELILTTTAMRIGKTKLLAAGLTNEVAKSDKENKASMKNYKELLQQDKEDSKKVISKPVDNSLLLSVFGKQVTEVKGGINVDVKEEEADKEDDRVGLSDEELLNIFN